MSERLGLIFSGESSYLNVVLSLVLLICYLLSPPFFGRGVAAKRLNEGNFEVLK